MSETPIFDEVASGRPFPAQPPVLFFTKKYWDRRQKKARALTDRAWKEICQQWNASR